MKNSIKLYVALLTLITIFVGTTITNNVLGRKTDPPFQPAYLQYCYLDGEYTCTPHGGSAIRCDWVGDGCSGPY